MPHRSLEYKLGWVGLILLGLSVPVILYKQMGWTWALITMGMLAAVGVLIALVVVIRRGRRIEAEVQAMQAQSQRSQEAHSARVQEAWNRAREVSQRSGMTTVEAWDMIQRINRQNEISPSARFAPGKLEGTLKLQRIKPAPKPDKDAPTAWERILSAESENSDEPG